MMQLSTGSRINSASDDAAGMQITNRMETQISGLDQAQRNANDAISMAQTAEGAMQETTDILNRTRDLALQSANGTNTADDRTAIQGEVDQLTAEIDDIAANTNFAGISLLDGSATDMSFQVGSEANETIEFSINFNIEDMSASALGGSVSSTVLALTVGDTGTDTANNTESITITNGSASTELDLTGVSAGTAATDQQVIDEINAALEDGDLDDITATSDGSGAFSLIGSGLDGAVVTATVDEGKTDVTQTTTTILGKVSDIDLTNQTAATQALDITDGALAQVDTQRAELGAVQNRLDSKVDNLSSMEENMSAAQSQMLDADFAEQTTEMTSNQMLMQSGASVLGQAKSMPQYANMLMG